MACGACSGKSTRPRMLSARATPTPSGGFQLTTYPTCERLHQGAFAGESVYVVGRGTKNEQLFKRSELAQASQHAKDHRATIENLPTTSLCDEAVLAVYG